MLTGKLIIYKLCPAEVQFGSSLAKHCDHGGWLVSSFTLLDQSCCGGVKYN